MRSSKRRRVCSAEPTPNQARSPAFVARRYLQSIAHGRRGSHRGVAAIAFLGQGSGSSRDLLFLQLDLACRHQPSRLAEKSFFSVLAAGKRFRAYLFG